jgi:hypothetical protein
VSEDPVVIMKMMLLLFLDNVRSERELMRMIPAIVSWACSTRRPTPSSN